MTRFSRVPVAAAGDRSLGATDLRVLIALCAHAGHHGYASPNLKTLGTAAALDQSQVVRALRRLERAKLIRRTNPGDEHGSCLYVVEAARP